jgi:SnoaL-like domain
MKILACALVLACCGTLAAAESTEETILAMERRAMDGWREGNPDEFLRISDPEITYFHSTLATRLEGLPAVKALYESYRGRPLFDRYEMADPKIVVSGSVAVLTYLFTTQTGSLARRWHATEVYRNGKAGWRIIHSHFSSAPS